MCRSTTNIELLSNPIHDFGIHLVSSRSPHVLYVSLVDFFPNDCFTVSVLSTGSRAGARGWLGPVGAAGRHRAV